MGDERLVRTLTVDETRGEKPDGAWPALDVVRPRHAVHRIAQLQAGAHEVPHRRRKRIGESPARSSATGRTDPHRPRAGPQRTFVVADAALEANPEIRAAREASRQGA